MLKYRSLISCGCLQLLGLVDFYLGSLTFDYIFAVVHELVDTMLFNILEMKSWDSKECCKLSEFFGLELVLADHLVFNGITNFNFESQKALDQLFICFTFLLNFFNP